VRHPGRLDENLQRLQLDTHRVRDNHPKLVDKRDTPPRDSHPIVWTSSGDYSPGSYTYQHIFTSPCPTCDNHHITQIGYGQFGKGALQVSFSTLSAGTKIYFIAHAAVIDPTGEHEPALEAGSGTQTS